MMTTPLCDLPEDMSLLRETARRFMRHEVRPEEDKLPHDATELPADVLKRLQAKARALGMWQVESPVEWGGAGLSLLGQAVVAEQASQCKNGGLYSRVPRLRLGSANRDI
jgi:acyl-CoA dehydrogenase